MFTKSYPVATAGTIYPGCTYQLRNSRGPLETFRGSLFTLAGVICTSQKCLYLRALIQDHSHPAIETIYRSGQYSQTSTIRVSLLISQTVDIFLESLQNPPLSETRQKHRKSLVHSLLAFSRILPRSNTDVVAFSRQKTHHFRFSLLFSPGASSIISILGVSYRDYNF